MQSKESRKELLEKELKIKFYMKAPTLILKENKAAAATEQLEHRNPEHLPQVSVSIGTNHILCIIKSSK